MFYILYCTLLYSTLLYSTLLYSTLLYSTLLYSTLLYSTLLYSTLLYYMINYTIWLSILPPSALDLEHALHRPAQLEGLGDSLFMLVCWLYVFIQSDAHCFICLSDVLLKALAIERGIGNNIHPAAVFRMLID